jgi:hypothetical protein
MILKVLSLMILWCNQLFGYYYDDKIIDIEAKLFPKIAMLEKTTQNKKSDTIQIYIVHNEIDRDTAIKFKEAIERFYPNKLVDKKISIALITQQQLTSSTNGVFIVLYHATPILETIANWANENHQISFVYDPLEIEYGFLGSIYIGKETQPYLNRQTIQKYNFNFDTYLLGVSKFYE